MNFVIFGLSITSSWGNGHATTYRGLVKELSHRGHSVLFLERDRTWYAKHRDLLNPSFCRLALYEHLRELAPFAEEVANAHCVVVGSYVPDGAALGQWVTRTAQGVTAFYDMDTPVTLAQLAAGEREHLTPELIAQYDLYLSFSGGPILTSLAKRGAPRPYAFYCSVDPQHYFPEATHQGWDLGYLGTYSPDRQPALEELLIEPAIRHPEKRFVVAGPLYPANIRWPENVERIEHLDPSAHRAFYNAQRFTLNITRQNMLRAGWSPSVRLFEAAACGTPIISDPWPGLESFFESGREIIVADSAREVCECLNGLPEEERVAIADRARTRILAEHTAAHRAVELEELVQATAISVDPKCPAREPRRATLIS